jgi:hypothetical protein
MNDEVMVHKACFSTVQVLHTALTHSTNTVDALFYAEKVKIFFMDKRMPVSIHIFEDAFYKSCATLTRPALNLRHQMRQLSTVQQDIFATGNPRELPLKR